ncbi:polyprenyl synthetase family protein [Mitsuokella sp.]|uniref:polyprenyl synthetase family protein n=1 Tax=Mitsuokella sp. TaxID=2049034 RepID=UPI0025D93FB1|nr:farnesyl diphosphate synthase [Mitsuokella sp.]MDY4475281.1 farnesyl diphosphate synthase [Mitsuokella sp.]
MQKELWNARRALVEKALVQELKSEPPIDKTLADAMEYSLMAGGKRLRPILLMAAADAVGVDGAQFVTTGCAIEMIHTYSLIHDDLPAMDNDDYRRGKLTNHKVYGAGMATLAGDALLTLAFEVMLRQQGVTEATRLAVVREMSRAAGQNGMVGGQAIDLESEGKEIPMERLREMHMGKTGALFRAAVRSGAILAGATDNQLAALTKYADAFGLTFQITDDILDVVGDEATIGKPVGSDERNHKSTYVTLLSLEKAQALAKATVEDAIAALTSFGSEADFLRDLVQMLIERKK